MLASGFWKTMPTRWRARIVPAGLAVATPSTLTVPAVDSSRALARRPRVLLPEPLAPTTASISPSRTSRVTSRTAGSAAPG